MDHQDALVTAASIIAGFGSAVIAFRLERELDIEEKNVERPKHRKEHRWIPVSHWLVVTANPTLWEGVFVFATVVAAATAFVVSYRG
jgi:hypothetical protein